MASTQFKRQKLSAPSGSENNPIDTKDNDDNPARTEKRPALKIEGSAGALAPTNGNGSQQANVATRSHHKPAIATRPFRSTTSKSSKRRDDNYDDADNLSDDTDSDEQGEEEEEEEEDDDDDDEDDDDDDDEDDDDDDEDDLDKQGDSDYRYDDDDDDDDDDDNGAGGLEDGRSTEPKKRARARKRKQHKAPHVGLPQVANTIQDQLVASGPAGVAAAAAIATVRRRRRPHTFETNPSVRKRQQTRLIRKLRACIDEYTARVGQQAVVLITMPGKTAHNFKVFGAQPLESVVRACRHEIMSELEQAVLEQTPIRLQREADLSGKHDLPPLVIDGIPTPVEKMTQAQLRAFIPLMLKYSTGRGKPGWGKESTRPPWWPTTLPWANVRSDARDEDEKQRTSWTTTLREIVTNCYKFHGREDLLPKFDEEAERAAAEAAGVGRGGEGAESAAPTSLRGGDGPNGAQLVPALTNGKQRGDSRSQRPLGSAAARARHQQQQALQPIYASATTYQQAAPATAAGHYMQSIQNANGSVSLIQVDPSNAQILTLPDGTQVRAVRLQALATSDEQQQQQSGELHTIVESAAGHQFQLADADGHLQHAAELSAADGSTQIILTSEDGTQSCYPMSQLVSIPASVYQQFAASGQSLQIITADGSSLGAAGAIQIHTLQEAQEISAAEATTSATTTTSTTTTSGGGGGIDQLQQVVVVGGGDGQLEEPAKESAERKSACR